MNQIRLDESTIVWREGDHLHIECVVYHNYLVNGTYKNRTKITVPRKVLKKLFGKLKWGK